MLRDTILQRHGRKVIVLDSMSQIEAADRDHVLVTGSNGGKESGRAAELCGCACAVFNDSGVGKDGAGTAGLAIMDTAGIPGVTISHTSAAISDGMDTWHNGVISCANAAAVAAGFRVGAPVQDAVTDFLDLTGRDGDHPVAAARQLINDPGRLVTEALSGLHLAYPTLVRCQLDPAYVLRAGEHTTSKVALVSGGGSGHEPLHSGFVGHGMLDAAVPGAVFTSPTPYQIAAAVDAAHRGAGALLIVKNYTGDVLNFAIAAELATERGIDVQTVLVDDDLATDSAGDDDDDGPGRRGTAAAIAVEKICGAAAERGAPLAELAALGRDVAGSARTTALALQACTHPGQSQPSFQLDDAEVEFGVGIHGERGIGRRPHGPARDLVAELARPIVEALELARGDSVIAIVNGLGSTHGLELATAFRELVTLLGGSGITVARSLVGTYVTALDMRGFSITLLRARDHFVDLWDAPVRTPALTW